VEVTIIFSYIVQRRLINLTGLMEWYWSRPILRHRYRIWWVKPRTPGLRREYYMANYERQGRKRLWSILSHNGEGVTDGKHEETTDVTAEAWTWRRQNWCQYRYRCVPRRRRNMKGEERWIMTSVRQKLYTLYSQPFLSPHREVLQTGSTVASARRVVHNATRRNSAPKAHPEY